MPFHNAVLHHFSSISRFGAHVIVSMGDDIFSDELQLFRVQKRLNPIQVTLGHPDSEATEVLSLYFRCFQLKEGLH